MGVQARPSTAQTICSLVLELQPESEAQLRALLARLDLVEHDLPAEYDALKQAVPLLHFLSVTIFPDAQYDPILVIEANFDGPPGPFWAQFEAAFGEDLRNVLRCGKPPRDGRRALFLAVTEAGSRRPVAPLLDALTVMPAVGHQGNRGLTRTRIENEGALFAAVQTHLDQAALPPGATQSDIHRMLRDALLPAHPCLADPVAPRIAAAEARADWVRLGGFAVLLLFVAVLPGVIVSLVLPPAVTLVLLLVAGAVLKARLGLPRDAHLTPAMIGLLPAIGGVLLLFVAVLAVVFALPASFHHWRPEHLGQYFWRAAMHFGLGVVGLYPTLAGVLVWVRALELRDAPQDAPKPDEAALQAMARREDKIAQNHMGSVVHLKPGMLRAVLAPVALRALGLVLRVQARNGYLGSMRTIHFAHWALISNGGRLMFFSNFDGSWESYLDDFIEKAHAGLTLAWTGGVGFPPTRFLILDGATQGRRFKAWARHSMAESMFWYSAYIDYTVNQIERQARVADGLRRPALTPEEAKAWALDL